MSLALTQEIATLEEILAKGPNAMAAKRLLACKAQLVLPVPVAEPVKKTNKKERAPKAERHISCCDCKSDFPFPEKEAAFFKAQGFPDPTRCAPCRAAKKAKHLQPVQLTCNKCSSEFTFTVAAQKHFKEQGWSAPIRCFDCRKLKKTEHEAKVAKEAEESKEGDESAAAPEPVPALPPSPPSE
jgi:hypothetical protein